jgi:serine/threonine-protein kinase
MKCPKCQADNTDTARFCSNCAAPLTSADDAQPSFTKTLETPVETQTRGTLFAERYKIIEELGRGGMGVVYKAEDTKLRRAVALKFLPLELTHIPDVKERFMREAQAAAALDHPNICTVYEFDEAEEKTFISMAYVEGQSLRKRLESGPFELDEALRIATQVAEGLQIAHKKGIVHRDIKSANIMVTEDSQAKIMDFGLARMSGGTLLTQEGTAMGTIAYMSPEQARGEEVDHRTDIWSFGVVLYEMLTGQLPFRGEHEQAVVYSIRKDKPRPITEVNAEIPPALEKVVDKALEKDAENRYQQVDELLDDLKSISAGIIPEEIKLKLRKEKLRKRRKAILYAGAGGMVILAAVLILTLFPVRSEAIDSIAVLPFENLTGDSEQEYFVDGVTDELIGQLGQISGLKRVVSRTSVMRYKDTDKSLPEIARELNVDALVEGTIYQVGDNVSIKLQLFDALPEERSLWTQRYNRPITDVLVMYAEMAGAIAENIQVKLTEDETMRLAGAKQVNPEAYEAYLKGQVYLVTMTPTDLETAMQYFNLALEKDPNSALAYAGISQVWVWYNQMGVAPPHEAVPEAMAAAEKALELDSSLAEVHYALALIKTWGEWNWEEAEKAFLRAIELNPNYPDPRIFYSHFLIIMKRPKEAIVQMDRALELDPFNVMFQALYAADLLYLRRYDEAIEMCRDVLRTVPNHWLAAAILIQASHQKGMYDLSVETTKSFFQLMGFNEGATLLTHVYEESGYRAAMTSLAEMLEEASKTTHIPPYMIADQYALAGNKDKTLLWFEKAVDSRDPNMIYYGEMPHFFDLLKNEARYQELLRKMNLPVVEKE